MLLGVGASWGEPGPEVRWLCGDAGSWRCCGGHLGSLWPVAWTAGCMHLWIGSGLGCILARGRPLPAAACTRQAEGGGGRWGERYSPCPLPSAVFPWRSSPGVGVAKTSAP